MHKPEEVVILLVEDDPGHARLIEKNLRRSNFVNEIVKLTDGQSTLDYLFGNGSAHCAPPSQVLVLLDLNMPGVSGYQVLERLRANERTRHIPVIVLTTTDDAAEIRRCYELGCNVYITKPVDYEQFSEAIRRLGLFLTIVRMPGEDLRGADPRGRL
jgi:CheY-like chemotaxis protein